MNSKDIQELKKLMDAVIEMIAGKDKTEKCDCLDVERTLENVANILKVYAPSSVITKQYIKSQFNYCPQCGRKFADEAEMEEL